MICLGKYDYTKEKCVNCSQRIECMIKKFENFEPGDEWGEGEKPTCFGAYKGRKDCIDCPYYKECSSTSIQLRKSKHKIRYLGKYKSTGKEIRREDF
jgi:hypothetical protein